MRVLTAWEVSYETETEQEDQRGSEGQVQFLSAEDDEEGDEEIRFGDEEIRFGDEFDNNDQNDNSAYANPERPQDQN